MQNVRDTRSQDDMAYELARKLKNRKLPDYRVVDTLIQKGYSAVEARRIIQEIKQEAPDDNPSRGQSQRQTIMITLLLLFISIAMVLFVWVPYVGDIFR